MREIVHVSPHPYDTEILWLFYKMQWASYRMHDGHKQQEKMSKNHHILYSSLMKIC